MSSPAAGAPADRALPNAHAVNKELTALSMTIRALPGSSRDVATPSSDLSPRSIPPGRFSSSTGDSILHLTIHGMHCDTNVEDYNFPFCVLHSVYDPIAPYTDPVEMLCPA